MKTNTLQQKFALDAHTRVTAFRKTAPTDDDKDKAKRKKYGSMAHKLPILIHSAGLAQAVAFVQSRKSVEQKQLLTDLAGTLGEGNGEALAGRSRTADLAEYMLLTRRALAALVWYKRYAESILGVTAADAADDDDRDEEANDG